MDNNETSPFGGLSGSGMLAVYAARDEGEHRSVTPMLSGLGPDDKERRLALLAKVNALEGDLLGGFVELMGATIGARDAGGYKQVDFADSVGRHCTLRLGAGKVTNELGTPDATIVAVCAMEPGRPAAAYTFAERSTDHARLCDLCNDIVEFRETGNYPNSARGVFHTQNLAQPTPEGALNGLGGTDEASGITLANFEEMGEVVKSYDDNLSQRVWEAFVPVVKAYNKHLVPGSDPAKFDKPIPDAIREIILAVPWVIDRLNERLTGMDEEKPKASEGGMSKEEKEKRMKMLRLRAKKAQAMAALEW